MLFWKTFCLWFVYKILLIQHTHTHYHHTWLWWAAFLQQRGWIITSDCWHMQTHAFHINTEQTVVVLEHTPPLRSFQQPVWFSLVSTLECHTFFFVVFSVMDACCEHAVINASIIIMIITNASSITTMNSTNKWHEQAVQSSNQYRSQHSRRRILWKAKIIM